MIYIFLFLEIIGSFVDDNLIFERILLLQEVCLSFLWYYACTKTREKYVALALVFYTIYIFVTDGFPVEFSMYFVMAELIALILVVSRIMTKSGVDSEKGE